MSDDGFLARWSRKKADARREVAAEPSSVPSPGPLPGGEQESVASVFRESAEAAPAVSLSRESTNEHEREGSPPEPPPPTMEDVAALPPGAEIKRFLAPTVDENVKRAAFKKLIADPHFNVMDGLDTYIDDYSQPDPIPSSMLRKLAHARVLGLFDEEGRPEASPDGGAGAAVPQSSTDSPAVPTDEDPDLRLQQDDAAGPGGTGEGPAA